MPIELAKKFNCLLFKEGQKKSQEEEVILEKPVSLILNGDHWITFLCTPTELEALGVGFLYNEGIIQSIEEIELIHLCDSQDILEIWLNHKVEKPQQWKRTSGCSGGATSLGDLSYKPIFQQEICLKPEMIFTLIHELYQSQNIYRNYGGAHTSALSDGYKNIITCEDIGRHNTLDKISGHLLLEKFQLKKRVIITTGRISSEMLQKCARIEASIVISRTTPTSLSIDLAEKIGITLIGYVRNEHFTIYSNPQRINF